MSMDKYPEQTMATLKALDMLGQLGGAVVTFVDGATGKIVSTSWNSLNPATQQQILGGGKILGVAFTAAQVAKVGAMVGSLESGIVKSTSLDWSIVDKSGETRLEHVNSQHGNLNLNKQKQGVFYGDPQIAINHAWTIVQKDNIPPIKQQEVWISMLFLVLILVMQEDIVVNFKI